MIRMKSRDCADLTRLENYHLLTNIKGILIFVLVCYHLVSVKLNSGQFSTEGITTSLSLVGPLFMLPLCVVPLFIIVTGYYSKDTDACRNSAFSTAFLPYVVLQIVSMIFFNVIRGQAVKWNLFSPYLQLWYLLSLFIWYLTLKDITRLKFAFPIMLAASLMVGVVLKFSWFSFDSGMNDYMSLFHTVAFYPYLLIGYYLKPEHINKIRNLRLGYIIGLVLAFLAICIGFFYFYISSDNIPKFSILLLKGDMDYIDYLFAANPDGSYDGFSSRLVISLLGIGYRLLQYVCVVIVGIVMLRLVPKKKVPFMTRLGAASLTVYCLHAFIAVPLSELFTMNNMWLYGLCVIVSGIAISWLLSLNTIHRRYTKFILYLSDAVMKKTEK